MAKNIYDKYSDQILKEVRISKEFMKATEHLRDIQVAQQQLVKKFKASDSKAKEKLKPELIALHKKVKAAEAEFEKVLAKEPVDLDIYENKKPINERKGLVTLKNSGISKDSIKFKVMFNIDMKPYPGYQFMPINSVELDKMNNIGKEKVALKIVLPYLLKILKGKEGMDQAPGYDSSSTAAGLFFRVSKIDIERHMESMVA